MNNDNYPPGAANDPRAPYNQVETLTDIEVSSTLTRIATISGDSAKDFMDECYTITELLTEFANLLDFTLSNHSGIGRGQISKYRQMKEECEAWIKNNDEEIETL